MNGRKNIAILGGGTAGLAAGQYARKARLPFTIYEAADRVGGNCRTLSYGDFYFDSGAHRFHDRNPEATREIKALLGDCLHQVSSPSRIYHRGRLIYFPPRPLDLLGKLGPTVFGRALLELAHVRLSGAPGQDTFEDRALHSYGRTIAELFLLNYSRKLWGVPCHDLSAVVAGRRLKGITVKTLLKEVISRRGAYSDHMEGTFYYPDSGIGMITDGLARSCGAGNIRLRSRITGVVHNGDAVTALLSGPNRVPTDEVVSTLPVTHLLEMMDPPPPTEILRLGRKLRFRNLVIVALFLDRESVNGNATIYFPDASFPFSRIYEPRNRSARMSPPGKTSLVAEVPCQPEDPLWRADDGELIRMVSASLRAIGWVGENEIIGSAVHRISCAYPILAIGHEEALAGINGYLGRFRNLQLAGRNATFTYSWIHDMMEHGRAAIQRIATPSRPRIP
jgi:protoporphyrinogen oxidase